MSGYYFEVDGNELLQHDAGAFKDKRDYPHLQISFHGLKVYSMRSLSGLQVGSRAYGETYYRIGVPTGSYAHFWNAASERIAYCLDHGYPFYYNDQEIVFFRKRHMTRAKLDSEINALKLELSSLPHR
jgi:hypothetical protein